jgi:PAS domain S-box-containing protein
LVYANPALRTLLGYENIDGLIGKPLVELVVPEDRDIIFQGRAAGPAVKSMSQSFEVKALRADGDPVDLEIWPGETNYEGLPAFLLFAVDTTESKALRAQALHSQKMEAIGTLAAGIAHEFSNLLTVASGFSEILLAEKSEGDPDYSDLQRIAASCARGAELVGKLRVFGRGADNYFQVLDLNSELIETLGLLSSKLPANISLDVRLDDCQRKIWADSAQLAQAIANLLLNAADAMDEGGKLSIKTKHFTVDEGYCRSHLWSKVGDYIELTVSDTGHGMDRETVSRIFEPFFTTRGLANNSGLGLSMVHGIVQEHGGHIACESEVGRGTTFRIYLPALSYPEQPECVPVPAESRGGTETILLVDDQDDIRDMGKRLLSQFGYTVLCASNGREALHVFREAGHEISLVILDLVMPEMGGRQCLEELLVHDPHVKVLIASGYTARQEVRETIQMGARDVVSKPFTTRQLLKAVRQALDGPDGG